MDMKARILALLVAMAMIGMMVSSVSAKSDDTKIGKIDAEAIVSKLDASSDVTGRWKNLTDKEQKAVIDYLKGEKIVSTVETNDKLLAISSSSGCTWGFKWTICGTNGLGQKLWCYFQSIDWCYDGSKITSKSRTRWGEVYYPFWSYDGHIGNSESGGVGQSSYRAWTQGKFKLCISGDIGCALYKYPWIDQTVYGYGGSKGSAGG